MIQIWRGAAPTEDAFHMGAEPSGHSLDRVGRLPRITKLDSTEMEEAEAIDFALRLGRRVVVIVCGAPYVAWQQKRYPRAKSRHGLLTAPGTFGGPLHALLLLERAGDGYSFYDPWFPGADQPFHIGDDDFQRCFGGQAVVALP